MSLFFRNLLSRFLSHFFQNLPPKSYRFQSNEIASRYEIRLIKGNQHSHCHKNAHHFDAFFIASTSGNNIACLMIRPVEQSKYTILFNHGGTVDLGNLCNFLYTLAQRLSCNIFVYDYSGFGQSQGSPTEKAVYADAETALGVLMERYHLTPQQIIVYGQSLGTAPSLHLAIKHPQIRAVVLHSPFLSIAKLYLPKAHSGHCRFYDYFKNVEMIGQVGQPVLIMHGTDDLVVPISQAKKLYHRTENPLPPLWVESGGHDDLFTFDSYLKRLKRLVEHDLK